MCNLAVGGQIVGFFRTVGLFTPAGILLAAGCMPESKIAAQSDAPSFAVSKPFFLDPPETVIPPPPEVFVRDLLASGIVIVVSKASQTMHVFRQGHLWRETPVSTGKAGKATPSGIYAILQKREEHYSNLYGGAPMPFMQRLTWDGIALHAGRIPGYPASNGCVRMPREFAEELFGITAYGNTAVIITDQALPTQYAALAHARGSDAQVPIHPIVFGYDYFD